jgi:ceramide glucosyltransferase
MMLVWLLAGMALAAASLGYLSGAILCVARHKPSARRSHAALPPVTILKPLCGDEIGLYENLASFFRIDYPDYQVVFGVRDAKDPALSVVERLKRDYPARAVAVVVNSQVHGTNLKISNLINMMTEARHDHLVIADSDISVQPSYLNEVIPGLLDPETGVVTCAYLGRPLQDSAACRLAALQINEWFLPSVLVARGLGRKNFCMGSTMAVRRDSLAAIGGLAALKDLLADDYMLGRLMVERGYRVELAPCLVETTVPEENLRPVIRHELRWARTVRTVEPASYAGSVLMPNTAITAIAGLFLALGGMPALAPIPLLGALGGRLLLHEVVQRRFGTAPAGWWLVPIRDILSFAIWAASFAGRSVIWRGQHLEVDAQGVLSEAGVLTEAVSEV